MKGLIIIPTYNEKDNIEFKNRYNMIPLLVNPDKYGKGYEYMCQDNGVIMIEIPGDLIAYI